MDEDIFSSFNPEELTTTPVLFLQAALDSIPMPVYILKAIRKEEEIIDFEYLFINKEAKRSLTGNEAERKPFLTVSNNGKMFSMMVRVANTSIEEELTESKIIDNAERLLNIKCVKFNDYISLSFREMNTDTAGFKGSIDHLLSIFDSNFVGISLFKAVRDNKRVITDFTIEMVSKSIEKLTGRTDLIGKSYLKEYPGIKASSLFDLMIKVTETGEPAQIEYFYPYEGFNSWYISMLIKKDDGVFSTTLDITERKKAELKITADAHFISQVIDTTPDIIYIMDLNTKQLIYANRQIAADLGYKKEDIALMKNPLLGLMYEEDLPAMVDHLEKMKTITRDDKVIEIEYRLKNAKGELRWFIDRNAVFKRNAQSIPVEKIGIIQNITERKLQQRQIATSLDILNQTEQIAEIGNWEYDIDTGNFAWSEGMYRLFNIPTGEKVSPEIYLDYTVDEAKATQIVNNIRDEFEPFEETISLLPPGQKKKIIKIKAVVIKEKNRPVKMVGVDMDITWQVNIGEEIIELNNMLTAKNKDLETLNSELKKFNTVAGRDYKETIQILYTNLEYIVSTEGRNLSNNSKANIRKAQSAIQKMKLLTEDINAYLYLYDVDVHRSLIDPNTLLEDVLNTVRGKIEQTGATIERSEMPPLLADPFLFSILVTHLLDNAIKFRKLIAAPVIKIKHSLADEMNSIPGALKNTPYFIISISDNGIGFTDEDAEKIFDLFFSLYEKGKYKGSGIGLTACKKIMSMHDGFITAEGIPASGATFNCYFPLRR